MRSRPDKVIEGKMTTEKALWSSAKNLKVTAPYLCILVILHIFSCYRNMIFNPRSSNPTSMTLKKLFGRLGSIGKPLEALSKADLGTKKDRFCFTSLSNSTDSGVSLAMMRQYWSVRDVLTEEALRLRGPRYLRRTYPTRQRPIVGWLSPPPAFPDYGSPASFDHH